MAIGRRPPFGLGTATKLAPAKKGAAAGHAWPLERKDTKVVSWSKKESVLGGQMDGELKRLESCAKHGQQGQA